MISSHGTAPSHGSLLVRQLFSDTDWNSRVAIWPPPQLTCAWLLFAVSHTKQPPTRDFSAPSWRPVFVGSKEQKRWASDSAIGSPQNRPKRSCTPQISKGSEGSATMQCWRSCLVADCVDPNSSTSVWIIFSREK